jgi:CRP/FNR family transcriptional regulator, cyclic AMP receptor protein
MIVKEIDLFKGIDPEVMEEIANICSEEEYTKDTVLFEKGEEAESLYILEQGALNLVIKNGGSLIYSLTEPGEVFGWSSLVESGLYTASGVCATDLKAVKIEREKLDKIFDRHPEVGFKVLKRLAGVISQRLSNAYRDLLSARGQDTTPSYG